MVETHNSRFDRYGFDLNGMPRRYEIQAWNEHGFFIPAHKAAIHLATATDQQIANIHLGKEGNIQRDTQWSSDIVRSNISYQDHRKAATMCVSMFTTAALTKASFDHEPPPIINGLADGTMLVTALCGAIAARCAVKFKNAAKERVLDILTVDGNRDLLREELNVRASGNGWKDLSQATRANNIMMFLARADNNAPRPD